MVIEPPNDLTSANPVLPVAVYGYVVSTNTLKIGDGVTAWDDLPELVGSAGAIDGGPP